ncbi:MAG: TolC family protein [Lentisphaerae bacterium]|nr:MAG: TolC family protein [Lentisphaerota bacterium]
MIPIHRNRTNCLQRLWILLCCAFAVLGISDDTNKPVPAKAGKVLQLGKLLRDAVARNPGLKAARLEWSAALARIPQVKAWPDPVIQYAYFQENVETRVGPQEHKIGVMQSFPFPGTLTAAGKQALERARIAQVRHEKILRDLVVAVKLSYYELVYLQEGLELLGRQQQLLQHALKLAETLYTRQEATLQDVLRARSEAAQLDYDRMLLTELQEVERAHLAALVNRPVVEIQGGFSLPRLRMADYDYHRLEQLAMERREELRIARLTVRATEYGEALAGYANLPKFTLGATRILTGEAANPAMADSGKDPVIFSLGMTLPWNWERNSARRREAEALHQAARLKVEDLENSTRAAVRRLYFQLVNARRLVILYEKTLLPQAAQAMEVAQQWQTDRTRNFSGFLETQSVWLNFQMARLRAATDYLKAQAMLEQITGGTLSEALLPSAKQSHSEGGEK